MYATVEEACAALLTHVCRHRHGLLINPSHCRVRTEKATRRMHGNPMDVGFNSLWECLGCPGPLPAESVPPPSKVRAVDPPQPSLGHHVKEKRCTGPCGKMLPATHEYFYTNGKLKDGLFSECKECIKARQRKHHQKTYKPKGRSPTKRNDD